MGAVEAIAVIAFAVVAIALVFIKENQLQDPDNLETIYPDQMRSVCQIEDGVVDAELIRQSGNLYREFAHSA